jgi:hypothetical protein
MLLAFISFRKWLPTLMLAGALSACSLETEVVNLPDLAPTTGASRMLGLGPGGLPQKPPVVSQLKYEYYECDGLVGDWFLALLVAEMNFLEKQSGVQSVSINACAVSRALNEGQDVPRYTVHLFSSRKEANECVVSLRCQLARNVTLVPREGALWRSYFLSDFYLKNFYNHCLAPPQKWHKEIACDAIPAKL